MTARGGLQAGQDCLTMLRRNLVRLARYPSMTLTLIGIPIVFLVLFVYVFGAALATGLGEGPGSRSDYASYLTPGILLMTVAAAAQGTAISVAMDVSGGLMARFRVMPLARSCVLIGHALGSVAQTMVSLVVVFVAALVVGFRPAGSVWGWLGAAGLLALFALALAWLSVAFGLVSSSPETASNLPTFLVLLPFLGSGFVPTATMPAALAWFARYQPFTPVTEAVRALLTGKPGAGDAGVAAAWSIAVLIASYVWAARLFDRPHAG